MERQPTNEFDDEDDVDEKNGLSSRPSNSELVRTGDGRVSIPLTGRSTSPNQSTVPPPPDEEDDEKEMPKAIATAAEGEGVSVDYKEVFVMKRKAYQKKKSSIFIPICQKSKTIYHNRFPVWDECKSL